MGKFKKLGISADKFDLKISFEYNFQSTNSIITITIIIGRKADKIYRHNSKLRKP